MSEAEIYKKGNKWQNDRYLFMANYNKIRGINSFGRSKIDGTKYCHIVNIDKTDATYNLLGEDEILTEVENRFRTKAGDKGRVLTNTVASQPCCFNLFAPLKFEKNSDLANKSFSNLLKKDVTVDDIVIEFTPNENESIGDQSKFGGTDADVAVFYSDNEKGNGVILIEFKYIENEFSVCTSYKIDSKKEKKIRNICDGNAFQKDKFEGEFHNKNKTKKCGYLKYDNWELTKESSVFSVEKIKKSKCCPFKFSLNQLWRNMLLAEKVARERNLNEFHFWVVCPKQNTYLWNNHKQDIESEFRLIMNQKGNSAFRRLDIEEDFIQVLESAVDNRWAENWLVNFRGKYLTNNDSRTHTN